MPRQLLWSIYVVNTQRLILKYADTPVYAYTTRAVEDLYAICYFNRWPWPLMKLS